MAYERSMSRQAIEDSGEMVFHLTVSIDPGDHELIDFLQGLADEGMTTRIEGDGDDLTTVTVLEVATSREEDEGNAAVLAEYMGVDDDRDDDTESSASRQHYIDTGRYLKVGEAQEA
jgi:hypothetical protein